MGVLECNCLPPVSWSLSVSRVEYLFFSVPWSLATKPCVCVCARTHAQSCLTPCDPVGCSPAGFSRREYWSGLLCLPPGDRPNPGTEPVSPVLAGRFFTTAPPELAFKLDSLGDSSSRCHAPQAGNPDTGGAEHSHACGRTCAELENCPPVCGLPRRASMGVDFIMLEPLLLLPVKSLSHV